MQVRKFRRKRFEVNQQYSGVLGCRPRFLRCRVSLVSNGDRGELHDLHRGAQWIYRACDSQCDWIADGRRTEFLRASG